MKKKSMGYVILVSALAYIALNMAHPVTPMFIRENNLPSYLFGVFFAAMSVGNLLFSPLWGKLSDKGGRIKYLIIGLIGYGLSQVGFGFSTNPIIIIIFRFLGGVFVVSFLTVMLAYIADITTEEKRLKAMAYYGASTTVGGAIGSLLGGILGNSNYKITFIVQIIICIMVSIILYLLLAESVDKNSIKNSENKIKEKKKISLSLPIIIIMVQVGVFFFATTSYNSSINYFIESVLNLPPSVNGIFLALAGILAFLTNLFVTPILGKRFGEYRSLKLSFISMALFMFIATITKSTLLFFIFIIAFVCCAAVGLPLLQNIISKLGKDNNGAIAGIQNSSRAVGMIIGSLYSGFIFDFGNKLPFITASIILIIGFVILQVFYKEN